MKMFPIFTIFLVTLLSCIPSNGQDLTAIYVDPLPTGMHNFATYYDGEDSIYIFGGEGRDGNSNSILRFDISSSTTEKIGELPGILTMGNCEGDDFKNIFCIGGEPHWEGIYKFSRFTNRTTVVGQFPYEMYGSTTIRRGSEELLIFGGDGNPPGVKSFNMRTATWTELPDFPLGMYDPTSVLVNDKIFIFAEQEPSSSSFLEVDLATLEPKQIFLNMPITMDIAQSATDGRDVYIIGHSSTDNSKGIVRLNPDRYRVELLLINDFPIQEEDMNYSYPPAAVYVENRQRIYFLGGQTRRGSSGEYSERDEIWFVDIYQTSQTTKEPVISTPQGGNGNSFGVVFLGDFSIMLFSYITILLL